MGDADGFDPEDIQTVRKYALQNAIEYDGKGKAGSVLGRVLAERSDLRPQAKRLMNLIDFEVEQANSLANREGLEVVRTELEGIDPEALKRERHKKKEGLRELPGDTSNVVLRFAPNPNGPLSIGHSRGVVINSSYAEKYDGKIVLRFDDTDTRVKPPLTEAYRWIEEDFEWLSGRSADVVIKASERMPIYLKQAKKMISGGHGYVCRCGAEEFRGFREGKTDCPCRGKEISESLEEWDSMNSGGIMEGGAVVRVKTSMSLPNPALRDWPALRIQHAPHPVVGDKYKVWPLLDFQSAVEDHEQGVTHIIRGKDLMDSTRKQTLLYQHFGWTYPETLYWGRVKVHEFGGFSTSGMSSAIKTGEYDGWDDARLPTLMALRRRGFEPQSLISLWNEIGLTQKDISISMQTLEALNSKNIDRHCERRFFVSDPKRIEIQSEDSPSKAKIARHPDGAIPGMRIWDVEDFIFIQEEDCKQGKLRLKDFADIEITGSNAEIEGEERSDGRPIIHWLPEKITREAKMFVAEGGEIRELEGVIEDFELRVGEVYQFERVGFARLDRINNGVVELVWLHG
jgi:glutamyl-tRNA synthetase